jgi:Tfp pilus assembly protein PilO
MKSLVKYLLLLLVIAAFGYGLGYRRTWPHYQAAQGMRADLETARAQAEEHQALEARLADLEKRVELHGAILERTRERLTVPADAPPVDREARRLAEEMGIAVKDLSMASPIPGDLIKEQPFSMNLQTSAPELALYLERLAALPGIVRINILETRSGGNTQGLLDVRLSASAFSLAGG